MSAALYGPNPDARWHGRFDRLAALSRQDLMLLHARWCAPNNALVVVAGPVTIDEVKRLAEEVYGRIPANPEGALTARSPFDVVGGGQRLTGTERWTRKGMFLRRYAVPSRASAVPSEAEALDVLVQVLNTPGRLVRPALGGGRANAIARVENSGAELNAEVIFRSAEGDPEQTDAALDAVIEDIRANGATAAELASAKDFLVADHRNACYDERVVAKRYDELAIGVPIDRIEGRAAAITKVTAADVKNVAAKYFDPRRGVTGWLMPEVARGDDAASDADG